MKLRAVLILILVCFTSFAQNNSRPYSYRKGYRFISKAEKYYEKGNYDRAQKLIDKSRRASYFCGNGLITAQIAANTLEAKIYFQKKEYKKLLTMLDSLSCDVDIYCSERDSLKIETLIALHGKDKVQQAFQTHYNDVFPTEDKNRAECFIKLEALSYTFSFGYNFKFEERDGKMYSVFPETIGDALTEMPYYSLLQ